MNSQPILPEQEQATDIVEPNQPWSAKATLGLLVLFAIFYLLISVVTVGIGSSIENAQTGAKGMSQSLVLDGDFNAINYLVCALLLTPVIFYFSGRKKVTTAAAYLGFTKYPTKKTFIQFNILLISYLIFSHFASDFLAIETPQSMIDIYNSTDYLFLLFIAVVISAPLFEEILFRGFLYKGLKYSPLGTSGAIIITSLLFTLIHAGQYEWSVLAILAPLAFLLGFARLLTGGIYLSIYLHFINNIYAGIGMYLMMN
jgi:membrane protease YdiL (CAAX protease family)